MDSFSHIIFALIVWVLFSWLVPIELSIFWYVLGAFIIDIDHIIGAAYKQSTKSWTQSEKRLKGLQKIAYFPRTWLHSIYGIALIGLVTFLLTGNFLHGVAIFLGLFTHLVLDSLDHAGVRCFYPYLKITGPLPCSYRPNQKHVGLSLLQKYSASINFVLCLVIFSWWLFLQ